MKTIYLDNNATTRVAEEVIDEMMPYLTTHYGNASSMHRFGGNLRHKIDQARQRAAELLGCAPDELLFTSGGTESDNTAIKGVLALNPKKRHIITTRAEHPAVRAACRVLQQTGCRLTELPIDHSGQIDLEQLEEAITDDTALITIMYANNETGVIFPLERIARLAKSRGVLFHTDAVQAAGKLPIDLSKLDVDLLSLSGHKIHAPKGVGLLYVRRGTAVSPLLVGGHQEFGKRAGTENVAGIVGLGKACELARKCIDSENSRVKKLRDHLENALLENCPDSSVNGDRLSRLPNTANISFGYVEGEAILLLLDRLGIAASSGSACTSGSLEPSHVLRAMGVPFTSVHGSIRFSLSRYNTEEEIDYVIQETPGVISRLRGISMFTAEKDATACAPQDKKPQIIPHPS